METEEKIKIVVEKLEANKIVVEFHKNLKDTIFLKGTRGINNFLTFFDDGTHDYSDTYASIEWGDGTKKFENPIEGAILTAHIENSYEEEGTWDLCKKKKDFMCLIKSELYDCGLLKYEPARWWESETLLI